MTNREANQLESGIEDALARNDLDCASRLVTSYKADARNEPQPATAQEWRKLRAGVMAARVAAAAGQVALAWDEVKPWLAFTRQLPPDFACHVHIVAAEVLARLNRITEAQAQLTRLEQWAANLDRNPFLRFCSLRVRLWLGDIRTLAADVARCAQDLEAKAETVNLILLRTEEALAWSRAGDLARADGCLHQARTLLGPNPRASPVAANVYLQSGRLAHRCQDFHKALSHFQQAEQLAQVLPAQLLSIQLRRLWLLVDLNQEANARLELQRLCSPHARAALPEEVRGTAALLDAWLNPDAPEVADLEVGAYRALRQGDMEQALQFYRRAFKDEAAPDRKARFAVMLGMLYLTREAAQPDAPRTGEDDAAPWIEQAATLARSAQAPEVLWRALRLKGQLVLMRNADEDQARALFAAAAQVIRDRADLLPHLWLRTTYRAQAGFLLRDLLLGAFRNGAVDRVFHNQELLRGQLILDLLRSVPAPKRRATLGREAADLGDQIEALEQILDPERGSLRPHGEELAALSARHYELCQRRDQLWEAHLCDRTRATDSAVPVVPTLAELQSALPVGTVFIAPNLLDHDVCLLVVRREHSQILRSANSAEVVRQDLEKWRVCLGDQINRYRQGLSMGPRQRKEMDDCLDRLGQGPLGALLEQAWSKERPGERLIWAPSTELFGLPVHALRSAGRYLVEDHEVVHTFSGALYLHHSRLPRAWWWRRRRALLVTAQTTAESPSYPLEFAKHEGRGVAKAYPKAHSLHFREATLECIRPHLARVGVVHFACHAHFDKEHPYSAFIKLPSSESWSAPQWLEEPVAGLPLATLSACSSLEVAPSVGGEVFGLVCALLGAGVRAVVGGQCLIPDRETASFMVRFAHHAIVHDLAGALARAQRDTLALPNGSPFYWAVFALYGDAAALPAPGWFSRGWAARRQRRHQEFLNTDAEMKMILNADPPSGS